VGLGRVGPCLGFFLPLPLLLMFFFSNEKINLKKKRTKTNLFSKKVLIEKFNLLVEKGSNSML